MNAPHDARNGTGANAPRALPSDRALALEAAATSELEQAFLRGGTPSLRALGGWEFRGINHPHWARLVGIKKFIKGFYADEHGVMRGYNCPVEQNGLDEPWIGKPLAHAPKRFGFYRVDRVEPGARDNAYLHAVLLDYGKGGNRPWDPTRGLRDYLVQVDQDNQDLYLGKAFYAVGPLRVATSFFILERLRPGLGEVVHR